MKRGLGRAATRTVKLVDKLFMAEMEYRERERERREERIGGADMARN